MAIVNDSELGFCYSSEGGDGHCGEKCYSNGFDVIPFDQLVPKLPTVIPSTINEVHVSSIGQKKVSKAEKRAQRQQKKINVAQRRQLRRQTELEPLQSTETVFNPYLTTTHIKQTYREIVKNCPKLPSTDVKLFQYRSIAVYKSDVDYILPGQWLNDSNISLFYELIMQTMAHLPQVKFPSQVQLLYPTLVQLFLHFPVSDHIESVLPIDELKKLKFIFIPINFIDDYDSIDLEQVNQGDHWALAVLSIMESKLYIYDSMFIDEDSESDKKLLHQLTQRLISCKTIINTKKIEVVRMKCDQQDNFDDCGVYVLMITCYLINQFLLHQDEPISMDISNVKFNPLSGRFAMIDILHRLHVQNSDLE
jgi:sentrin-specific protease 8